MRAQPQPQEVNGEPVRHPARPAARPADGVATAAGTTSRLPARAQPAGTVVDVFCGAGGLSHGFVLEGFDVRAGIDIDAACRHAYERNNGARFLERDVAALRGEHIRDLFAKGQPRILVGCAPCQPFSTYSQNRADAK